MATGENREHTWSELNANFVHFKTIHKYSSDLGSVHTYPDISNPHLFLSGYGYRPQVSGEFDSESEKKLIRSPEWKKK